jgi:Protein of unknown function (DUF3107)
VTNEVDALGLWSRSGLGSVAAASVSLTEKWPGGVAHWASTSLLTRTHERKGSSVEVKIGVTDSPRELIFNSAQTPSEVEKLITDALGEDSGVLALTDEKGRRFLVQSKRIAYVEIGAADVRRVGFGVGAVGAEALKSG